MFWTQDQRDEENVTGSDGWREVAVEHTASEEAGDWLLINTQQTPIGEEKPQVT